MTDDSATKWTLLTKWLERIEASLAEADRQDDAAWREYRQDCEKLDKALAALRAELQAVKTSLERHELKRHDGMSSAQRLLWAVGTAIAAALAAKLVGMSGTDVAGLIQRLSSGQ